jgi:hypothetical protein
MFKDGGFNYGFGWEVLSKFGHKNISHGGAINGFTAQIDRYPDDRLTIIILSNVQAAPVVGLSDKLAVLYLGVPERTPFAGAEAAIRRVFASLRKGEVAVDDLSPAGAALYRDQMPTFQPAVAQRGDLRTIKLLDADANGADRYRLTFEKGALDWTIRFDATGRITPLAAVAVPTDTK